MFGCVKIRALLERSRVVKEKKKSSMNPCVHLPFFPSPFTTPQQELGCRCTTGQKSPPPQVTEHACARCSSGCTHLSRSNNFSRGHDTYTALVVRRYQFRNVLRPVNFTLQVVGESPLLSLISSFPFSFFLFFFNATYVKRYASQGRSLSNPAAFCVCFQEGRVKVAVALAEKTPPSSPSRRRGLEPRSCPDRASASGSTSGWALDLYQWRTARGAPSTRLWMFSSTK